MLNNAVFLLSNGEGAASASDNWSGSMVSFGQFFLAIVIFIVILYLAYLATKFMARSRMPKKGSNFELTDTMSLGQHSHIQIVRAGKKYFLLGISKDKISLLAELRPEDIMPRQNAAPVYGVPFEKHLSAFINNLKRPKAGRDDKDAEKPLDEGGFQ